MKKLPITIIIVIFCNISLFGDMADVFKDRIGEREDINIKYNDKNDGVDYRDIKIVNVSDGIVKLRKYSDKFDEDYVMYIDIDDIIYVRFK